MEMLLVDVRFGEQVRPKSLRWPQASVEEQIMAAPIARQSMIHLKEV